MPCPNCGSKRIFYCTDSTELPITKIYFTCADCGNESRKIKGGMFRCTGPKPDWELELEKLESEWS